MYLTRLLLLVFIVWSVVDIYAESDIKLSSNTTSPHHGSPFTLVCTVTGDIRSEPIIFVRNNATICKRLAYNSTTYMTRSVSCTAYFNTKQGYHCQCDVFYAEKKVYYLTVKTFKQIDATQWFCKSVTRRNVNNIEYRNSNVIDLYADLELSTNSPTAVYGRPFTLVCTVTGNTLGNVAVIFVRNNKTICKRFAYMSNIQRERPFECSLYYNTIQEYLCACDAVYENKKVYSVTIKSFKAVDTSQWSCRSVGENDHVLQNSNVVHLNVNDCFGQTLCDTNAICNITDGSYMCTCQAGYSGDGQTCNDIDECLVQTSCGTNADCNNTNGSYTCTCLNGYSEDGQTCAATPQKATSVNTVTFVLAATTGILALLVIILAIVVIRMRSKPAESKVKLSDIRLGDENPATSVYEDVHDNNTVGTSPSRVPVESSGYGRSAPTGEHDYQNEQGLPGNNDQQTNTYERLDVDVTGERATYETLNV